MKDREVKEEEKEEKNDKKEGQEAVQSETRNSFERFHSTRRV